ncbi:MAG: hypothetical protein LBS45_12270 [Synergistaceae bacterium]|jgi:hypothetical protein|nr:hypothetical protein [Synergistaceae bacterium]
MTTRNYLLAVAILIAVMAMNLLTAFAVADLGEDTAALMSELEALSARQETLSARLDGVRDSMYYLASREALSAEERERTAAWHETAAQIVTRETGGQDYRAAALVAYCIYNGLQSTGMEPEAFLQTRQYNMGGYPVATDTARLAVSDVFDSHIFPIDDEIEFYYAPALTESPWHESLGAPVLEYAGHRYFTQAR